MSKHRRSRRVRFCSPLVARLFLGLLVLSCAAGLAAQHGAPAAASGKPFVSVNLERHLEIKSMTDSAPPRVEPTKGEEAAHYPNTILFSFRETSIGTGPGFSTVDRGTVKAPAAAVKRVEIAFAHEGYRVLHILTKTNLPHEAAAHGTGAAAGGGHGGGEEGGAKNPELMWTEPAHDPGPPVFYIYWKLGREEQEELERSGKDLEYRFIVDGVWMADPRNPLTSRKANGALVSRVSLHALSTPPVMSPEIVIPTPPAPASLVKLDSQAAGLSAAAGSRQARTVTLRFVGKPGIEVFAAGTFNQFDPWLTPLRAVAPAPGGGGRVVYAVTLRLLAGQYHYHFVINGKPYLDALNPAHGFDAQGTRYSKILVP